MSAQKAIEYRIRSLLREQPLPLEELQETATLSGNIRRVKRIVEDLIEVERVVKRPDGCIELSEMEARRADQEAERREEQARLSEEYGWLIEVWRKRDGKR
jgi:hypothetical protein